MFYVYLGGGCGKSSVVGKVVELSRKNRSLSAELASEQNKVKQLEDKLKNLTCEEIQQSNRLLMSTAYSASSSCEHDQDTKVGFIIYVTLLSCENRQLQYLKIS